MLKGYHYFYIVIFQTAIQYLGNFTLSLVVTRGHDKKLAMPISGFMQKKYSSRQHQQRFTEIEFVSMCSSV